MKIYRIRFNEKKYLSVHVPSAEMGKIFSKGFALPRGNKVKDVWPLDVNAQLYNFAEDNQVGEKPDISFWDTELVLSPKALGLLESHLESFCEFLPIKVNGEVWSVANVICYFDEINESESEISAKEGIKKLSFMDNKITNELIFRTHYGNKSTVFCTQDFIDLVHSTQLSGLIFQTDLAYYGPIELGPFYSNEGSKSF